jgi:peroxisomal enoyl-CoA hydratase 2
MSTPFFEDLDVGDAGPELVTAPLTRSTFVKYAGASGDFNPMHHDETYAQKAGRPSVFGHGMYTAGVCSKAVADWVGIENIRSFKARFISQVWPEDVLTISQTVTEKTEADTGGTVDLDLTVQNQGGETVMTAKSRVELPSKA